MARGYKPTKKGLTDFLNFAVEVAQIARPEYENVSEGEALTLIGLALKENFDRIIAEATGATLEQVEAAKQKLQNKAPTKNEKSPSLPLV